MKISKTHLLVACAASTFVTTAAQAQVALPAVELRGGGATSVGDILPRTLNCIGNPGNHIAGDAGNNLNQYGDNAGGLHTVEAGKFAPTTPTATSPAFDCATQAIQPNFQGKYIGTGSGTGRTMWRGFQTATSLDGTAGKINPFTGAGTPSTWSNLQFAFSDSPIAASDLTTYNSTAKTITVVDPVTGVSSVKTKAGNAIQIPFYVLPVAFAYNPVYGVKTTATGSVDLKFNIKVKGTINGVTAGGLKLSREAYCKIFNGEIVNWNDALLKTLNGGTSLGDAADLVRFNTDGAPIRLVGRADNSGTTDIFTRALAAQCGGFVTVNKFVSNAQALPFAPATGGIDITRLLGSSSYKPGGSGFAGSVQSLSGFVYDKVSDVICLWSEVNNTSKVCTGPGGVAGALTGQTGPNGDGLFMVADGSGGVANAILSTANNTLVASSDPAIKLNGKFGYIGADWIVPVTGRTLYAAQLQIGNAALSTLTKYAMPSATNASTAFGAILPPETVASSGAWAPQNGTTGDQRNLGSVDPSKAITDPVNAGASTPISRANPLHWTAAVYNPNKLVTETLASPAAGYPLTGVTMLLTYTCFKPADSAVPGNNAKRFAVAEYMGLMIGKITKTSTNAPISSNTFKGTGATALGIIPGDNIAQPSAAWQTAINETFLKTSTQAGTLSGTATTLGKQNLWIQDNFPTTASDVDGSQQATDQKSNPSCDANYGA